MNGKLQATGAYTDGGDLLTGRGGGRQEALTRCALPPLVHFSEQEASAVVP